MYLSLDKTKKYLLACSFGPDSMALFGMLLEAGYLFEIAYVDYHYRGTESDEETRNLLAFATQHNIYVHLHNAHYETKYGNFEGWARKERYNFFKHIYDLEKSFDSVLVAHHQDDVLETYLLQKRRRNRPLYYGMQNAIKINNMPVLRPLLEVSKSQLRMYCLANEIPFSDDSTNYDLKYERNKIRHEYIAKLNVAKRTNLLQEIKDRNANLENLRSTLKSDFDFSSPLDITKLKKLNDDEFANLIFMLLETRSLFRPLSRKSLIELQKMLSSAKPNIEWNINDKWMFAKAYKNLYLLPRGPMPSYEYTIDRPKKFQSDFIQLDFTTKTEHHGIRLLDYPLIIRPAKRDDNYLVGGYRKSVLRLFIDWKMPRHIRDIWPVFVNKSGVIVYIPRYRADYKKTVDSDLVIHLPFIC